MLYDYFQLTLLVPNVLDLHTPYYGTNDLYVILQVTQPMIHILPDEQAHFCSNEDRDNYRTPYRLYRQSITNNLNLVPVRTYLQAIQFFWLLASPPNSILPCGLHS